jgi:hypothetical protein|tara:strand:- start:8632 stop:9072 length:441 start_codon:yes stop_codon:yes gene_type:complete
LCRSNQEYYGHTALLSYRSLFIELERVLGRVLLPIDRDATDPTRLISSNAAFVELTRSVAENVYQRNRCRSIHDPVDLFPTLDALGQIKRERRSSDALDVVAADFLERLGATVIRLIPKAEDRRPKTPLTTPATTLSARQRKVNQA